MNTEKRSNADEIISTFNLYEKKMYHIAFSILKDCYLAEDAVMDAFVKMLSGNYKIKDSCSAETKRLIIKVIQSASIDIYRKNKRRYENEISAENNDEIMNSLVIEGEFVDNEQDLLAGVPEKYKIVLREKYIEDSTNKEIADKLKLNESTVRKRIERGLSFLRKRREMNNDVY